MAFEKKAYPEEFLSPLNAQKPGKDPMPDPNNIGKLQPPDPLGVVPGGGGKGTGLKGNK